MRAIRAISLLAFVGLVASGCAGTKWYTNYLEKGAESATPLRKVLVIGIAANTSNRRVFEDAMVASLAGFKVDASPSYDILPGTKVTEDQLRAKVREGGYDGVIITRLVARDVKTDVAPPSNVNVTVAVTTGGGPWGPTTYVSGYSGWYGEAGDPTYLSGESVVRIQTRVWSAKGDGTPLWTGISDTVSATDIVKGSEQVAKLVGMELRSKKLI